jgi:hypothetical protein
MKRIGMMTAMAVAILVSAGVTRAAAQESVSPAPASPVSGGKVIKEKSKTTMTAVGAVKTVAADSLAISDSTGKDWTFVIDAKTKILPGTGKETVDVGTASPVEGGKVMPSAPAAPKETIDVAPVSPIEGGKVIPPKMLMISDIKEGQRVQVSYHTVDGKMHATQIRVM